MTLKVRSRLPRHGGSTRKRICLISGWLRWIWIKVPYTIDGPGFTGVVVIEQYDPDTWEDELEKIHKRQETLRTKGGARTPELTQEDEAQEDPDTDGENGGAATELEQGYTVTANSALSEYLAVKSDECESAD